jgi:hypothetical protein
MTIYSVYDQIAELIATLPPAKVLALRPPQEVVNRFEILVEKSKNDQLDVTEKDELDHFVVLERLIRLAKIRAQGFATA